MEPLLVRRRRGGRRRGGAAARPRQVPAPAKATKPAARELFDGDGDIDDGDDGDDDDDDDDDDQEGDDFMLRASDLRNIAAVPSLEQLRARLDQVRADEAREEAAREAEARPGPRRRRRRS